MSRDSKKYDDEDLPPDLRRQHRPRRKRHVPRRLRHDEPEEDYDVSIRSCLLCLLLVCTVWVLIVIFIFAGSSRRAVRRSHTSTRRKYPGKSRPTGLGTGQANTGTRATGIKQSRTYSLPKYVPPKEDSLDWPSNPAEDFADLSKTSLAQCNATVVTAYFPMDNTAKHSNTEYLQWMRHFLTVQDCMVIYTTPEMASTLYQLRSQSQSQTDPSQEPHRTILVTTMSGLHQSYMATKYGKTFWQDQYKLDPEGGAALSTSSYHHTSYLVYLIWNEKTRFLQRTAMKNPFGSHFLAWVDIGYLRNADYDSTTLLHTVPTQAISQNRIVLMDLRPIYAGDSSITVGGGFIGGNPTAIQSWHDAFYGHLDQQQSQNVFIGKDQPHMLQTCQEHSDLCTLIPARDGLGDPWFYMAAYTSSKYAPILQKTYLAKDWTGGRLGNQIFEWASTVGLAITYGRIPCQTRRWKQVNYDNGLSASLREVFDLPVDVSCPVEIQPELDRATAWNENAKFGRHLQTFYDPRRASFRSVSDTTQDVRLDFLTFLQSYKYFDQYKKEVIGKHFQFRPEILQQAEEAHTKYKGKNDGQTFTIGIHVRRGDMLTETDKGTPEGTGFYERAVGRLFEETSMGDKSKTVVLIVGRDVEWHNQTLIPALKRIAKGATIVPIEPMSEGVDLALLALCDHVVVSAGTYGWWGAYLGPHMRDQGRVVYYKRHFERADPEKVVTEDHFPTDWIGLD